MWKFRTNQYTNPCGWLTNDVSLVYSPKLITTFRDRSKSGIQADSGKGRERWRKAPPDDLNQTATRGPDKKSDHPCSRILLSNLAFTSRIYWRSPFKLKTRPPGLMARRDVTESLVDWIKIAVLWLFWIVVLMAHVLIGLLEPAVIRQLNAGEIEFFWRHENDARILGPRRNHRVGSLGDGFPILDFERLCKSLGERDYRHFLCWSLQLWLDRVAASARLLNPDVCFRNRGFGFDSLVRLEVQEKQSCVSGPDRIWTGDLVISDSQFISHAL